MPRQKPIEKEKLFLVEGADAYFFSLWACQAFDAHDIQVIDFGGVGDFGKFLKTLKELPNYENVKTLAVARDAERNANGAVQSVQSALNNNGFSVPGRPFTFSGTAPRVAYMVFPGFDQGSEDGSLLEGTLEDLCLSMTEEDDLVHTCVDIYIDCLKSKKVELKHPHKTRLHAFLAGKNEFAGLKIGEAAQAGAWNWNHDIFKPFRDIIKAM